MLLCSSCKISLSFEFHCFEGGQSEYLILCYILMYLILLVGFFSLPSLAILTFQKISLLLNWHLKASCPNALVSRSWFWQTQFFTHCCFSFFLDVECLFSLSILQLADNHSSCALIHGTFVLNFVLHGVWDRVSSSLSLIIALGLLHAFIQFIQIHLALYVCVCIEYCSCRGSGFTAKSRYVMYCIYLCGTYHVGTEIAPPALSVTVCAGSASYFILSSSWLIFRCRGAQIIRDTADY